MLGSDEIPRFLRHVHINQYSGTSEVRTIWGQAISSQAKGCLPSKVVYTDMHCIGLLLKPGQPRAQYLRDNCKQKVVVVW